MPVVGPSIYQISFTPDGITGVESRDDGLIRSNFRGQDAQPGAKLYVVSNGNRPLYVGRTKQPIRRRLNKGFQADDGRGGRGYAWRHDFQQATIAIWRAAEGEDPTWIETVEAEVVFLIRQEYDQWPSGQTEIHFHPSLEDHRLAARAIVGHYR